MVHPLEALDELELRSVLETCLLVWREPPSEGMTGDQHHQARVGQEVRRGEQEVSRGGQEGIQREVRSRPSSLVSSIGAVLRCWF